MLRVNHNSCMSPNVDVIVLLVAKTRKIKITHAHLETSFSDLTSEH